METFMEYTLPLTMVAIQQLFDLEAIVIVTNESRTTEYIWGASAPRIPLLKRDRVIHGP